MERFTGLIGVVLIFAIAFLMSNNRKAINYKLVFSGLAIQISLAVFILKIPIGKSIFAWLGDAVTKILNFSQAGAAFVFGPLVNTANMSKAFGNGNEFIFFFNIIPTIIFVAVLVSVAYYLGIMQRIVKFIAYIVYKLMGVSGSEALSNVASAFVGQVEAQIMIKPYLKGMTMSELLASMTGSMACIAGGVMAVYIALGVPAEYLIAASLMAAPAALVISKIVWPETEISETKGRVSLEIKKTNANLVDAISHGASDGLKVGLNVVAMLIGFIANDGGKPNPRMPGISALIALEIGPNLPTAISGEKEGHKRKENPEKNRAGFRGFVPETEKPETSDHAKELGRDLPTEFPHLAKDIALVIEGLHD
jgi:CNT family concentrative nucleoside transporter